MKSDKRYRAVTLLGLILSALLLSGCSNDADEPPKGHVFKGYQNAMEKAKQVQPQLEEAEEQRRKQLEELSR